MIHPFVKRSCGGILVQLELNADHILPGGGVDIPCLIESVGRTIEDQRVVVPFWLLYALPGLLHPELLSLPDPPPEPGLLVIAAEPPHPAMTTTWSANANEQRRIRKSRNNSTLRIPQMQPAQFFLF
jgi:hypothetical protein